MKDYLYSKIADLFDEIDGQNKDGLFITIGGQQFNIKITAKKTPVTFEDNNDFPKVKKIDTTADEIEVIKNLFDTNNIKHIKEEI